jgi:hypothetical protein
VPLVSFNLLIQPCDGLRGAFEDLEERATDEQQDACDIDRRVMHACPLKECSYVSVGELDDGFAHINDMNESRHAAKQLHLEMESAEACDLG